MVLDIPTYVVREAFDDSSHEFIIVEDVTALERTLGWLVHVFLDDEAMLAKVAYCVFGVIDHVRRRVRAQAVVYGLQLRRDLLVLGAPMASRVLGIA